MSKPTGPIVSEHKDRVVYDEGDRFVKVFDTKKARDEELARLRWLEAAGVKVPEIVDTSGTQLVTLPLAGEELDKVIWKRWAAMPRAERTALVRRVAALCARIRDAGFDWPDLVTYHIFVADDELAVLDPARLRKGKLELTPLYYSVEEPTVSRSDRLRFWRAYAGRKKPPRLRDIGHRGRFRPYRWVCQRTKIVPVPVWSRFVKAVDLPFESADDVLAHPDLEFWRKLGDRWNGRLGDLFVKVVNDPDEARTEWENYRRLMGSGWRLPQPALGGVLKDGRGLFCARWLEDQFPIDDIWDTLDRKKVVRAVADVARRLHVTGFVHKDLYLCHLFARKGGDELTMIDLQRLTRTRSNRLRVKDLAALVHSARGLASRTDLMRGLKRYGGDRKLARRVLRKARRIAGHVPKNIQDGSHVKYEHLDDQ
ncbi:MAG: lipopolysaccharide kinase InaA family protein [Planctomycetota bacterium]|jgi:tRNA A-37 threonylcarbamoyl transferase component Bud32